MIKHILAASIVTVYLSGCATVQQGLEQIGTKENYVKCQAADIASTALFLQVGGMHEFNPLTKALVVKGLGQVAGTVVPLIGLAVAGWYILKWIDTPVVTGAVTVAACGMAVHNLYILGTLP